MKGWQALCWGGWQDSPSGLTPGKETFGENPPGQHLGLTAFKWRVYLIFTLAPGDGGFGGELVFSFPGVGLPSISPYCPSRCL